MIKNQIGVIRLRAHPRAKSCTLCLILALITAFCANSSVFSSLIGSAVISSTGVVGLPGVIALSGSPADIQAAVNTVNTAGGGTVYVPAGTWHWNGETVTIPGGVNIIAASLAGCMGHENNWQPYTPSTFLFNDMDPDVYNIPPFFLLYDSGNGKSSRISGFHLEKRGPSSHATEWQFQTSPGINLQRSKNFRIDHCNIINCAGSAIYSSAEYGSQSAFSSAYGLVDHCIIDNPYKIQSGQWEGGYGCGVNGNMRTDGNTPHGTWIDEVAPFAGKYEAIQWISLMIVEDCHFSRTRHAIDGNNGGVITSRYNLFDPLWSYLNQPVNIGDITGHGPIGGTMTAVELLEAYENTVIGRTTSTYDGVNAFGNVACRLRGGHGLIWGNHFHPPAGSNTAANWYFHISQDGTSVEAGSYVSKTYVWDYDDISNCALIHCTTGRVEGVDYFLRAPTLAQDGWSYTPYPYPHPLVAG